MKTSHRDRDPIPPNNLPRKLSHFFHPPKISHFPISPLRTPRVFQEQPPAETKRQWTSIESRNPFCRATMSQHLGPGTELWPLSRSAFSIRVRPGGTIPRRFPFVSFSISADYTVPVPSLRSTFTLPANRFPTKPFFLFFSSFLFFFSPPDNINSWEKFREF